MWSDCFDSCADRKKTGALCIIWANTLLKSAPPRLHNWRTDKLVIMSWNEQRVDWRAGAGVTPSLTLGALQAAVVSHGAEELEDEDGDSHHRQAHNEHHHPHRRAVGLCSTHKHTHTHTHTQISDKLFKKMCPSSVKQSRLDCEQRHCVLKVIRRKHLSCAVLLDNCWVRVNQRFHSALPGDQSNQGLLISHLLNRVQVCCRKTDVSGHSALVFVVPSY